MISLQITDTDAFLDMPATSQLLYFHLTIRADDEGFVSNPKKISRLIGVQNDDLKVLIAKRFVLDFDSGVVVIKHWLIHNTIRMDRFNKTVYQDEKNSLEIKENKAYTELATTRQPVGNQLAPQVKLSKDKLSKDNITVCFEKFWSLYPKKISKKKTMEIWNKIKPDKNLLEVILKAIEVAKKTDQWKRGYIPHPTTYLNQERWNDKFTTEDFESDDNNQITIIK